VTGGAIVGGNRGCRTNQLIANMPRLDVSEKRPGKLIGAQPELKGPLLKLLWCHGRL
jgi:hypothetical protein